MIHHVTRATRHLVFWTLLITAIGLTVVRLMLVGVDRYKTNLETRIAAVLGTPVQLGGLGANMRGITPELVLKNLVVKPVLAGENPAIQVKEIRWGINLGEYLLQRQLLPSSIITLVGAQLSIYRAKDGHFAVEGLKSSSGQPLWLFQGQFNLLNSHITWQDRQKKGKPMMLDKVNLAILNEGTHHRVNAVTSLPASYGGDLKLAAEFDGSSGQVSDLTGTVFVEGTHVKVPDLIASYLPMDIRALSGSADFKVWSRWQHNALESITGVSQLKDTLLTREGNGHFPINKLEASYHINFMQNGWRLNFDRFELKTDAVADHKGKQWPNADFSLGSQKATPSSSENFSLYVKEMDLAEISQIAAFFAPLSEQIHHHLTQADIKGLIQNFSIFSEPSTKNFAIAGRFLALSVQQHDQIYGLDNLNGRLKGSNTNGVIELEGEAVHLTDKNLFANSIIFDKLKGLLNWQQKDNEWTLSSNEFEINSPAFRSKSRFLVAIPKTTDKPFIDLQMAFAGDDANRISAYLPTQIMKEKLKLWLSNSLKGGKLSEGQLLFYGKTDDFPFTNGAGVFEASLNVDKGQVKFHPQWPEISAIKGNLTFDKNVIEGTFEKGQIGKAKINQTGMIISGLGGDAKLEIKGGGEGEITEILKVLQQSPLASRVNPVINNTSISGISKATLNMTIPLKPGMMIAVDASAALTDANLTVNRLNLPINKINGVLKINNQGVFAEKLHALALGQVVDAAVATVNRKTQISFSGHVGVQDIAKALKTPELLQATGASNYQLQVQIPDPQDTAPIDVNLKSGLEGIEFTFPGGIAKTPSQRKPLEVVASILGKQQDLPMKVNYNNELKAALRLALSQQKIISGHVLLGRGTVNLPLTPGIKLEINKSPLALQDWVSLATANTGASGSIALKEIKIHSESAFWKKTRLDVFDLTLKRNPTFWSGELNSVFAKGVFDIPIDFSKPSPAVFAMDMINLSMLRQFSPDANVAISSAMNLLPNVRSKMTLWQSVDLGQLSLETERTPLGVKIKQLNLEGQDESLEATGDWENLAATSVTHLQGRLVMKRADQFFSKLNITKDFTDTSGNINFQLNWHASPWQLKLPDLRGHMDVNLNSGRILSIEPGFGRVLGILALEQWIKRLQLDFSDIFEEGLSFNYIKGDFNFAQGKASTQNLFIDAVPAKITIVGDTDLVNQTVDHVIKVVPKSSDAVPIAGTIMGKIAEFIGKTVTGKNQEGFFFGREYLVKGSWNNANVKPLHENDGIFQKTWNNITGVQ